MKDDFEKYLEEQLKDKEFRKEWEALEPEYTIMKAIKIEFVDPDKVDGSFKLHS